MAEFFLSETVLTLESLWHKEINGKVTHFYNYNLMIEKQIFKIVTNSVCKHMKIMLNQVSFWLFTALVNHLFQIYCHNTLMDTSCVTLQGEDSWKFPLNFTQYAFFFSFEFFAVINHKTICCILWVFLVNHQVWKWS